MRMKAVEAKELRRAAAALDADDGVAPPTEAVGMLQSRVALALHTGQAVSPRDLRETCKVYFHPPSPLGRNDAISVALLDRVATSTRNAPLKALFEAYLQDFDADDPAIGRLAKRLRPRLPSLRFWPEGGKRFCLLDPDKAPTRIAEAVLASDAPIASVLSEAGLDSNARQRGGLAEAAFARACRTCARGVGADAEVMQRRLLSWGQTETGVPVFGKAWPTMLDALLAPWAKTEPQPLHKARLLTELPRLGGGDPRMKTGRWGSVRDREGYRVLLRWLTRASVLQFLDVVDESLRHNPDGRRMWSYRRAFWTSYLTDDPREPNRPTIHAAWIAFGASAAALARGAAKRGGEGVGSFGTTYGKGADQSALIVEIGDWVIADWSHSAKYNVWRRGDRTTPVLFKSEYSASELYNAPTMDSHGGAAGYTWQKRLAGIIEEKSFWSEKATWRPSRV